MSFYNLDTASASEQLIPPQLRNPKRLAWLQTLLAPLQQKHYDTFSPNSFYQGFADPIWDVATAYTVGYRVRFGISIYECLVADTGTVPPSDSDIWLLICKDFVGASERVKYNSGKMLFEYILNRYLNTTTTVPPLIYIVNNTVDTNGFYMGVDGDGFQGELGTDTNQDDFLGTAYTLGQTCFTIFVPIGLANTFTSETADVVPNLTDNRENIVRNIADKFTLAGMLYDVKSY